MHPTVTAIILLCSDVVLAAAQLQRANNVVFLLMDDQDCMLGGMEPMEITKRLIAQQGATFTNAFVSTPVCCPSRSSILTGKYVHNHHVINNTVSGNCSSQHWRRGPEKRTMATYLKSKGYATFYGGKYLNQYGKASTAGVAFVPPGYDRWIGLVGNSRYYNYTLSVDGREETHGSDYTEDYLTDLLAREMLRFIDGVATSTPFFAMVAPPAPHSPFTNAPQFDDAFSGRKAPRTPNFNARAAADKHWLMRQGAPLAADVVERVDDVLRRRWRTLLSVDRMVADLVDMLDKRRLLDSTYIIVTSDHGYHLGQFAMAVDKRLPYESDIRVPLLMRGPGIAAGSSVAAPVVSIDLAPTVLDIAHIDTPADMDGVSLLPLVSSADRPSHVKVVPWRTWFLIEYHGEADLDDVDPQCQQDAMTTLCLAEFACKCQDAANNSYSCFRSVSAVEDSIYCQFNDAEDFVEYYDLRRDPYQLTNKAYGSAKTNYAARGRLLDQHATCTGHRRCFNPFSGS